MDDMKPPIGATFRHKKTGKRYVVEGHCLIEKGKVPAVLYRGYLSSDCSTMWCRPVEEFMDGRFELVGRAWG